MYFVENDACLIYPFNLWEKKLGQHKSMHFTLLKTEYRNISKVYLVLIHVCNV